MIREQDMPEANGLIARLRHRTPAMTYDTMFAIQCRLLQLGVQLENPIPVDDPRAPQGGSAIAMRKVA